MNHIKKRIIIRVENNLRNDLEYFASSQARTCVLETERE
jgi:hypothetical protein